MVIPIICGHGYTFLTISANLSFYPCVIWKRNVNLVKLFKVIHHLLLWMTYLSNFLSVLQRVLVLCTWHNYSEQIAKIIRLLTVTLNVVSLVNSSLAFFFMLNTPHTFYWGGYNFELNRDIYSSRIAWNPPSFDWARNDWNGSHCG